MAWMRWRAEASTERRITYTQWHEDGRICSRSLGTDDPEVASYRLRHLERAGGMTPAQEQVSR